MSNPKFSSLHLGNLVEARARELDLSPAELGRKVNLSQQTIRDVYHRMALKTDFLFCLSKALQQDLFLPFSRELALTPDPGFILAENTRLHKEVAYLEEINRLLRQG
ncbi:MAG: hypothetical protein H6581_17025 [Bacteroidia bacterium]|nr:hypothetical protein [Bacteroidia bacterium]